MRSARTWSPRKPPRLPGALIAADDATLTIVPEPRGGHRGGGEAREHDWRAQIEAIIRSASAGRILSIGVRGGAHPALLTSTSIRP